MQTIYLAMARGILMGKADDALENFQAMLPEVTDWVSAVNDPAIVLKLAKKLEGAQVPPPLNSPYEKTQK